MVIWASTDCPDISQNRLKITYLLRSINIVSAIKARKSHNHWPLRPPGRAIRVGIRDFYGFDFDTDHSLKALWLWSLCYSQFERCLNITPFYTRSILLSIAATNITPHAGTHMLHKTVLRNNSWLFGAKLIYGIISNQWVVCCSAGFKLQNYYWCQQKKRLLEFPAH